MIALMKLNLPKNYMEDLGRQSRNKLDELVNLDPQQIAEEYYVPINPYRESNY